MDSGVHIGDSRFQIMDLGFKSLNSKANDSGFHKKIPEFQIPQAKVSRILKSIVVFSIEVQRELDALSLFMRRSCLHVNKKERVP